MRRHVIAAVIAGVLAGATADAYDSSVPVPPCMPVLNARARRPVRVRPRDVMARHLVERGMAFSPTFAHVVSQLTATNVVVYVDVEPRSSFGPSGRLQFMGAGGGQRYLRAVVEPGGKSFADAVRRRQELTAVLGHELQHALEVGAAPAVVNTVAFLELYRSIGIRLDTGIFDTVAAQIIGAQVLAELTRREPTAPCFGAL